MGVRDREIFGRSDGMGGKARWVASVRTGPYNNVTGIFL